MQESGAPATYTTRTEEYPFSNTPNPVSPAPSSVKEPGTSSEPGLLDRFRFKGPGSSALAAARAACPALRSRLLSPAAGERGLQPGSAG